MSDTEDRFASEDERDDEEEAEEEPEEEEEDEDEEEDIGRSKKKRRKNRFIEEEAAVDDDEEEEDEEEDGYEQPDDDFEDSSARLDTSRHRDLDRQLDREEEESAEVIAARFQKRYGRTELEAFRGDMEHVPQKMLIPGVRDPKLWMLRCKPGKEREVIFSLMRKSAQLKKSNAPLQIYSAFARDSLPGLIYIEARVQASVATAVDKITNLYAGKLQLVPVDEMVDCLNIRVKDTELKPGAWVRVKKGTYAGDLAQIVEVMESGDSVTIKLLPRLDHTPKDPNGDKKRKKSDMRPPQKLFNPQMFKSMVKKDRQTGGLVYMDKKFDRDGYLEKDVKTVTLETTSVNPTLEEITRFSGGAVSERGGALAMLASASAATAEDFQTGESVEVIDGDMINVPGTVESVENGVVTVRADEALGLKTSFQVPASHLRKRFKAGDLVKVINGTHRDQTGLIVNIVENIITLLADSSYKEIQVFSKDLRAASEVSTSSTVTGQYDVQDLVFLSPTEAAVVTKVEGDTLTVLTQFGVSQKINPQQITTKRNSARAITSDSTGRAVSAGDAVHVVDPLAPEHKKRGTVLHIHHKWVFVRSLEVVENSGILVTQANNVTLLSGRGGPNPNGGWAAPQPFGAGQRGGFGGGMNGGFRGGRGGGGMGRGRGGFGRDPLVAKTVKIVMGEWKGYLGIVKDVINDQARVELHTASRIITISKEKLKLADQVGTGQSSSHGGYGMGGRTPMLGSRTPAYGDGGRTPAWDSGGGRTPAWNSGSRTPGHNDGGRTPAWDSGSKTPAWDSGSKTPAWDSGSRTPGWMGTGGGTRAGSDLPFQSILADGGPETPYNPSTPAVYDSSGAAADNPATPYGSGGRGSGYPNPGSVASTPGGFPGTPLNPPTPFSAGAGGYNQPSTPLPGGSGQGTSSVGGGGSGPTPTNTREWFAAAIEVNVTGHRGNSFGSGSLDGQHGHVQEVTPSGCRVRLDESGTSETIPFEFLTRVVPTRRDSVVVVGPGEHSGAVGTVKSTDGSDAIVVVEGSSEFKVLPISRVAKRHAD
ncbi:hypothetical protein BDK51DRAFT_35496 [Blyttiomyces helicus]|uniref:Transcription elongation factor SPT5 n=1 Tax=Blyttiomyces helicus TaxID=388810 RepID=A0A4P9WN68_9FUNG|nr:hypothetical protein BDK51DRAFT_35496 [Blyttiomyces helicus]|eukprot:RKO92660.1 hypothetical protein BDK51DRAFT_35496 [Blyttiomyces helicus]